MQRFIISLCRVFISHQRYITYLLTTGFFPFFIFMFISDTVEYVEKHTAQENKKRQGRKRGSGVFDWLSPGKRGRREDSGEESD